MDAMLTGITRATAFLDDIIISGTSQDELLQQLISVFERIQQYGFHVRAEKCQFYWTSIKYLGFIFDKTGQHPDPKNISAIKTLRSFLRLVSHYSSFLPELHRIQSPLNHHLLKKEITWNWSPECKAAFAKIKTSLSSDLLTHFNPSLDIVVVSDAVRELPFTSHMIKEATASDPLQQEVISYHHTRWPTVSPNKQLLPFFQRKSSLSEVDGVLLFAEWVIIPSSLQNRTLKQFHFGHQGVSRMKALARG